MKKSLIGKICVDEKGKLGLVKGLRATKNGMIWYGVGVGKDNKGFPWQARNPKLC